MIRNLYNWVIAKAATRHAERTLAAVSFAESSFFPIPPDVMLVPMCLANPQRAWFLAALTTVASVVGGLAGYAIGYFFIDTAGQWLIEAYHLENALATFQQDFADYGVWIILIKGVTPIPYKLVTIAAGMAHFQLVPFILASIVTRAARFFLVAAVLRAFGARARVFIERYLGWIFWGVLILLVGGFAATALL